MSSPFILAVLLGCVTVYARKTYPGFTVFDNHKGEYLRVIGPTLAMINVSMHPRHPPFQVKDTVKYSLEATPTVPFKSLYVKGQILLDDFVLWSADGTENFCDSSRMKYRRCPWKAGVTQSLNGSLKIMTLSPLTGFYKGKVEVYGRTSENGLDKLVGAEFAINLQN